MKCWWCRHSFGGAPLGIPFKRVGKKEFHCFGHYCSFECACADAQGGVHSQRLRMFSGTLLVLLRKELLGIPLTEPLLAAPHWSILKDYGGSWSISRYRAGATAATYRKDGGVILLPFGFVTLIEDVRGSKKRRRAVS